MTKEFYEDFCKLGEKDRKEVINLMQYKIHIDNKNFKNRVEHLENIIEGLESDVRVLGEHIEDDYTAHEEALKWCVEAQELSIENEELKDKINIAIESTNYLVKQNAGFIEIINKAIEYIEETKIGSILEVHCGEEEEYTEPLLKILKGED